MGHILVVEDDEQTASLLNSLINSMGHDVTVVITADHALELLPSMQVDLILMDMRLPGMKGWEATHIIKSDPNYSYIPIFAVTVEISPEDRTYAFEAGCNEFVTKPFNIHQLRELITHYIG